VILACSERYTVPDVKVVANAVAASAIPPPPPGAAADKLIVIPLLFPPVVPERFVRFRVTPCEWLDRAAVVK
jgi:hypothetical protein